MRYRDELPGNCPPPEAEEIAAPRIVHHFARRVPPTRRDFRSQRQRRSGSDRSAADECIAAGLSVFADPAEMADMQRRGYFARRIICRVVLSRGAGKILKTRGGSHYTWWPAAEWDIAASCSRA